MSFETATQRPNLRLGRGVLCSWRNLGVMVVRILTQHTESRQACAMPVVFAFLSFWKKTKQKYYE